MTRRLNPDPDLDGLIRELNASASADSPPDEGAEVHDTGVLDAKPAAGTRATRWKVPVADEDGRIWLDDLLDRARKAGASDLLLVVGAPPVMRVNGILERIGTRPLTREATALLSACLVPDDRRPALEQSGTVDFSGRPGSAGRIRCNVHRERGSWAAAVRLFPEGLPDLTRLGLPSQLERLTDLDHGLVLVTGPTGSGKSTTLAAMIRRILTRRRVHLVTIEDPVEFDHTHGESVVEHIEVGRDVDSFSSALRSVLRQDPDVMLIGEMRDVESMSLAITAAETGHLVLSTLHTPTSTQTIFRLLDSFPRDQSDALRTQLASSLAGIVSQRLLPRADGKGRVPAVELLLATPAVRNLIRKGKIEQIPTQLTLERTSGMLSFERCLAGLVHEGRITAEEARARAFSPDDLEPLL